MTTAGAIIAGVASALVVGGSVAYIRAARGRDDSGRVQRRVLAIVALGLTIGLATALARLLS